MHMWKCTECRCAGVQSASVEMYRVQVCGCTECKCAGVQSAGVQSAGVEVCRVQVWRCDDVIV